MLQGKPLHISDFHRFAAIAACNLQISNASIPSEKKRNYVLEGIPKIGLFTLYDVSIIFRRRSLSLHGKLVIVASCWLLKFFFLKSNDVLDAVFSTDIGEQQCFKFLIRRLLSLSKTKIICSATDRKPFVACGFCGVKNSPLIG